jgi:hypothetical protein
MFAFLLHSFQLFLQGCDPSFQLLPRGFESYRRFRCMNMSLLNL